jgi:hypothetical protein
MKQFFSGSEGVFFSNRLARMNSEVADFLDGLDLEEKIAGEVFYECRFVDERTKVVVIRAF